MVTEKARNLIILQIRQVLLSKKIKKRNNLLLLAEAVYTHILILVKIYRNKSFDIFRKWAVKLLQQKDTYLFNNAS